MHATVKPDVFNVLCPSHQVLDRIADKWVMLTIYALARGTKRYSELQREIGGVSQKMLTQTLRNLERDGLVQRKVYPVVPPMVEYSLTPLGETLVEPLRAITSWSQQHLGEVVAARARHGEVVAARARHAGAAAEHSYQNGQPSQS